MKLIKNNENKGKPLSTRELAKELDKYLDSELDELLDELQIYDFTKEIQDETRDDKIEHLISAYQMDKKTVLKALQKKPK